VADRAAVIDTTFIAIAAAGGAFAGVAASYVAAPRSRRQPDPFDVDAEADVIAAVLADPTLYFKVSVLEEDAFVYEPHRHIWSAVCAQAADSDDDAERALAAQAGLPALAVHLSSDELIGAVRTVIADRDDSDEIRPALDDLVARDSNENALLSGGAKVLGLHDDRVLYAGGLPLEPNPDGGRAAPMKRAHRKPSIWRTLMLVACGAAGFAAGVTVTQTWWQAAAVLVAVAGLLVVSAVDVDTMYVDYGTLIPTVIVSWGLAITGAVVAGDFGHVARSVGLVVAMLVSLELLAFVYRKLRRREGLGGGDTVMLLLAVGTPALAGASYTVTVSGIVVAAGLAIIVNMVQVVLGRRRTGDPFAFVPYLAAGWLVAWALLG
jgi:prepilin signal peptidase PulO-like enzyme (type II secretory pathway)